MYFVKWEINTLLYLCTNVLLLCVFISKKEFTLL